VPTNDLSTLDQLWSLAMTFPAYPDFCSPAFLHGHLRWCMAFYEGRAIDSSGGMNHFYLDDGTVFDARTRHLVNATRFVVTHALPRHR
jgi:mannose/cellobiose epimerase-like protein (N-acyl-D-glucosamine 2-epimerase family)